MKLVLRRVFHASETELKKSERYTTNTSFESEFSNQKLNLLPVPEFVESACSMPNCDKSAICMVDFGNNNFRLMCVEHLNQQFPPQKAKKEKVLVVPSIEQAIRGNAFEWQPQGKNDNWYKIRGPSLIPDSQQRLTKKEIKDRFYEIMSKILED